MQYEQCRLRVSRFDSLPLFSLHFHSLQTLSPTLLLSLTSAELNSIPYPQHIQLITIPINMMPPSLGLRFLSTLSLLSLLLLLLSPTLATPSSSSSASDDLDNDSSNNNDRPSANYSYQPPTLQQQHVFAVDSSSSSLLVQNSNQNITTMCNKAASNPNRVVLPANVTPSHYTLSIVPDLKEFTFGGQVAIE